MKKRTVKKKAKKVLPKRASRSRPKPATPRAKKVQKPVGQVTHFFGGIKVAIIKCKIPFTRGAHLRYKGATTDFADTAVSMQYNHVSVVRAKKGQQIGVKVKKRVREGDLVYLES